MRRTIFFAMLTSSLMSIMVTALAMGLAIPSAADAQESRIRAERVIVVDDTGTDRVTMSTGPATRSAVGLHSAAGITRAVLSSVAPGDGSDDSVNLVLFPPEGRFSSGAEGIARLGTGVGGVGSSFHLADRQGEIRIWLRVDGDGNPSIEMRDASGNVTWSAQ